ncbi:RteC domain-containing protein [Maribellus maritimus]|uniref:RteC domain-containing protein n=1 Tax=Maribellus maritimus TaxID=2870838 RepID=UPI001EEAB802|nr:RteC domain-containing protein [Maribellus maritimus]MCG6189851.1 RteC domain-containing protein [Maribellus maritimus]
MSANYPNEIFEKLEKEIEFIKNQSFEKKEIAEKSVGLCQLAFLELRNYVLQNDFKNVEEEIYFFKVIKPKILSKLIFYNELLRMENYKLLVNRKLMLKMLNDETQKIHEFIKSNKEFYHYYTTNETCLDENYFVRSDKYIFIGSKSIQHLVDPQFATLKDEVVAYILAYEQLGEYLDNEISLLKNKRGSWQTFQPAKFSLKMSWTASKVALVELIYALHCCNCINNGNVHVNELIEYFEYMFDVKLYKAYRVFTDIKDRKRERAKFLVELKTALLNRLDDLDALN